MYEYELEYTFAKHKHPYTTDIQTLNTEKIFNKKIYPVNTKEKHLKLMLELNQKVYDNCKYPNYLYDAPSYQSVVNTSEILKFKFVHRLALCVYALLYDMIKPNQNKILLICKVPLFLDALQYIYKYILQVDLVLNIIIGIPNDYEDLSKQLCIKYNFVCDFQDNKFNNEWIEKNTSKYENVDIAMVDYIIRNNDIVAYRGIYQLNPMNGAIILALKKLNKNGMLFIASTLFTNIVEFQYYNFLSYFFEKIQIKPLVPHHRGDGYNQIFIVCTGYNGRADFQTLLELNKVIYTIYSDTSNYILPYNPYYKNINATKINDGTQKYIKNFVNIPHLKYKKFKRFQRQYMEYDILNVSGYMRMDTAENSSICPTFKKYTIMFSKKVKLPLLPWYDDDNDTYFNEINKKFSNLDTSIRVQLNHTKNIRIAPHDQIIIKNKKSIDNLRRFVKKSYVYVEQYDKQKFDKIKQWFINKYNQLNKILFMQNISKNDKYVSIEWKKMYDMLLSSIVWMKMYEMIHETKILELCKNKNAINIRYICDTTGNFINAVDHYMVKYLPDVQHIKHEQITTKDTNMLNLYNDCDIYINDCGQDTVGVKNKLLSQLICALLMPRIGGGFILKIQNCVEINNLELSMIYIMTNKYKNVVIFRSNTNFWSTDIYIVGYNKIEITDEEKKIIKNCMNSNHYPVKNISSKFMKKYVKLFRKILSESIKYCNYFLFLSTNKELFIQNKNIIEKHILKHLNTWMAKYMG